MLDGNFPGVRGHVPRDQGERECGRAAALLLDPNLWPAVTLLLCRDKTGWVVSDVLHARQSILTFQELLRLESAWHKATCLAISHLGCKTFHVVYKNRPSALTLGRFLTF